MAGIQEISLDQIAESSTNPRKHFGPLDDLIESVRSIGVLQPVLLRPRQDHPADAYELVFGARRFRAAREAGLSCIPAMVRTMTDLEALEAQLVENCNREDVHPLEEADAYRALHETHGYGIDDLAAKVGKSRSYVYGRLKLCALGSPAREAFAAGALEASVALLLARIPDEKLQAKATMDICAARTVRGDEKRVMTFREAQRFIQDNYMLRLSSAQFGLDDAELVPSAGACTVCPKRTGNQVELFADAEAPDLCTDPPCHRKKLNAYWKVRKQAAKRAGDNVLSAQKSREIYDSYSGRLTWGAKFEDLDEGVGRGNGRQRLRKLLGTELPPITLAQAPDGSVRELVSTKDAHAALKSLGLDQWGNRLVPSPKASKGPKRDPIADLEQEIETAAKKAGREAALQACVDTVVSGSPEDATEKLKWFAAGVCEGFELGDYVEDPARRRGWTDGAVEEFLSAWMAPASLQQVVALLVELSLSAGELSNRHWFDGSDEAPALAVCKVFGVDYEATSKAAIDAVKAERAGEIVALREKLKTKKKATKKRATKKSKAALDE